MLFGIGFVQNKERELRKEEWMRENKCELPPLFSK